MNLPLKTFLSQPSCEACAANVSVGRMQLCPDCERYVNQDHVSQRELPLAEDALQVLISRQEEKKRIDRRYNGPTAFLNILKRAKLSPRQEKIFQFYFEENLSFFAISKKLGISKDSVVTYYRRGLKRLKKCHTNLRLVRGNDSKSLPKLGNPPEAKKALAKIEGPKLCPVRVFKPNANGELKLVRVIESNELKIASLPKQARPGHRQIQKVCYPRACPRCNETLLKPKNEAPYCAGCLWVPELYENSGSL